MDNLKEKTLTGLFWNLAERVGVRIVQFIPTIILARLLSPEEFGLVGMLALFVSITQIFLDSGFGVALIQKKDATYTDECSIFYFNILVGGLAVLVLFFLAPLVAGFYNQPILTPLMRWLSMDLLITAFGLIQVTVLTRKMDFVSLLKANLLSTLAGGAVGVAAAYLGMGVWSLVLQTISNTIFQTITLWMVCDWRPAWVFSLVSLRGMFGFGSRMLSSNLVSSFFDNLYQVFIGKAFSAASLGHYTRALSLRKIVIDTTSDALSKVLFPSMASIQEDTPRLKRAYRKSILLATFLNFPLMLGLIVIAGPLITLLFSAKWGQSIPYFQWMCAAGLLYPLHVVNLEVLKVKGRSDLFFQLTLIKRTLMVAAIIITYRWGISAMLMGQVVNSFIGYFLNSLYSGKLIGYSVKQQLADILPNLAFASVMALGMAGTGLLFSMAGWEKLLAQSVVGVFIYFLVHFLARTEAFSEAFSAGRGFWATVYGKG
ncbi:MAG: lipopolysaccharide biosynthesis protein [Chloroflexota bacterium]